MTYSPYGSRLNENRPVLIVSPPRSGSSLTSNIIESAGVFGGTMKPGDKYNSKGYFENIAITEMVVGYLREHDKENKGKRYHPIGLDEPYENFGGLVLGRMKDEGLRQGQRWFYKNTKIPLCWRLWDHHFPNAQWVIVKRKSEDILSSLLRTEFMDAYKTQGQWVGFLEYYKHQIKEIQEHCDSYVFDINKAFLFIDLSEVEGLLAYISKGYASGAHTVIDRALFTVDQ